MTHLKKKIRTLNHICQYLQSHTKHTLLRSFVSFQLVSIPNTSHIQKHECIQELSSLIWHSEDRASWYILIMKANEMHCFSNLFDKYSTCFGQVRCPSSGVSQHCIHATGIYHVQLCWRLLAWSGWNIRTTLADRSSTTNTYWVYTVLRYYWWWTMVKVMVNQSRYRPGGAQRVPGS